MTSQAQFDERRARDRAFFEALNSADARYTARVP
jgi:hypothetical protein